MTLTTFIAAGLVSLFLVSCRTSNPRASRRAKMKQRFAKIDTDKDGRLSFNEYQNTRIARASSDPHAQFSKVDTDGNGYISKSELRSSMSSFRGQRRKRGQRGL